MNRGITSKDYQKIYDEHIIDQGIEFQIDKYYEPKEIPMRKRIDIVLEALKPQINEKILDIGCGVGTFAFHAAKAGAITTGIDYSVESIRIAKILAKRYGISDKTKFVTGNAAILPFRDSSFDKIVSADFIEHITFKEKYALCAEIYRVLKPNGICVIFTPNGIREKIGDIYWHIRHLLLRDKIPVSELHFGLTHKFEFENILRDNKLQFRLFYSDITRPYLARVPFLKVFLSLNLLWIINKQGFMRYHMKDSLKEVYLNVRGVLLSPFLLFKETRIPKKEEIKTILILRHDGVGDMVLSTPLFRALKKNFPDARLTVLASQRNYGIIENNPNVDEILIYKGFGWFINEIRRRDFDMVIDPFITYELSHAFMAYLSRAKYRIGFEKAGREIFFNVKCPSVSYDKRMIEAVLDLVEAAGCVSDECEPEIFLTEGEKSRALKTLAERGLDKLLKVAIHPGALYPIRMWPIERFGEVARRLTDEFGIKVLVFGGSLEKSLLDKMHDLAGDGIEMFYYLKLRQFISLLSCCNLLLCNNSGPLHIASALKIPTVSMVGPSFIPLWLPWGKNHIVIRKELPCSPCNKVECEDHSCMNLITVEEVMDAVRKQLRIIQ